MWVFLFSRARFPALQSTDVELAAGEGFEQHLVALSSPPDGATVTQKGGARPVFVGLHCGDCRCGRSRSIGLEQGFDAPSPILLSPVDREENSLTVDRGILSAVE